MNQPPIFIIDACRVFETAVGKADSSAEPLHQSGVTPEKLRLMRTATATAPDNDLRRSKDLVIGYIRKVQANNNATTKAAQIVHQLETIPEVFYIFCWTIWRCRLWERHTFKYLAESDKALLSHISCGIYFSQSHSRVLLPRPTLLLESDILVMKYGQLLHKLRLYRGLDTSRLHIFQGIISLIDQIESQKSSEVQLHINDKNRPGELNEQPVIFPLPRYARNRLLENLWKISELTMPETASTKSINKNAATPKLGNVSPADTSAAGTIKLQSAYADLLQSNEQVEQLCHSEMAFMKWATTALNEYSPDRSRPRRVDDQTRTVVEDEEDEEEEEEEEEEELVMTQKRPQLGELSLEEMVFQSVNMMGDLEESMMLLLDTGSLEIDDITRYPQNGHSAASNPAHNNNTGRSTTGSHRNANSRNTRSSSSSSSSSSSLYPGSANSSSTINTAAVSLSLSRIAGRIDATMTEDGLTVAEIDAYFDNYHSSHGNGEKDTTTSTRPPVGEEFEFIDKGYSWHDSLLMELLVVEGDGPDPGKLQQTQGDDSNSTHFHTIDADLSASMLSRHVQLHPWLWGYYDSKQSADIDTSTSTTTAEEGLQGGAARNMWEVVAPGVEASLHNLRQIHRHTLHRTAAACTKFCPFDIVLKEDT